MRYTFLLSLILILPPLQADAQDNLRVVAISPARNTVSAGTEAPVVVTFDHPVDPSAIDASSFMVFGRWSGVMPGEWVFEEGDTRVRFVQQRPFSAGEMVTVSLARHITTPSGISLARGYAWQYWTQPRRASLVLEETARLNVRRDKEGHIQTYGAYAGDFNGDGFTDFAVPNERTDDVRMFMNDGTGSYGAFTVYPIQGGAVPSTNEGADFNLDGHLDFAVGNSQGDEVSVFMGTGTGALQASTNYPADDGVRGLAVLDLNGDGYPDMATANRNGSSVSVLLNDGDGTFTRTQNFSTGGSGETAAAAADFNEDGLLDLAVGSYESSEMAILLGNGEGLLVPHTRVAAGGASWMIAAGDVNGDGHADVVSANSATNNASVLLGDGQGHLNEPATYPVVGFPLSIDLGDLDGDGDLDMVTSNYSGNDWSIYENLGDGTFGNKRSLRASRAASCAVLHDRDNDGTLDLTGIDELDDLLFLFTTPPLPTSVEIPPPDHAVTLSPNYPNPFRETTTLTLQVDQPSLIQVAVYDVLGREVRLLVRGNRPPGPHTLSWDGTDAAGQRVPTGVYFVRLQAQGTSQTQRVVVGKTP